MRKTMMNYVVVSHSDRKLRVLPEGPWETAELAQDFADAECHKGTVEFALFAEGDKVCIRAKAGNQFVSPTGEGWQGKMVRMLEGWTFPK
jgi:hypothetical protein